MKMNKALKIFLIIIASVTAVLITIHISVVGICWGLDIFKIKDLADFIGWDNIEYVTANDTYINLILHSSSYDSIENKNNLSETERVLNYLERINSYINSNDHYKKMKVKIQYGERLRNAIGLSNVVTFANYSLSGKNEERYDGFYSIMWEDGIPIEFGFFHVSPWNNMREITFWNYFAPENPEEIKNLTKLDYLYFHEKLDEEIYNELCTYAPWCEIEVR